MARRNAQKQQGGAQPFLTASAHGHGGAPLDESAWAQFLRTQIYAPEHRAGNWSILTGVAVFAGAIVAARTCGDILVPV